MSGSEDFLARWRRLKGESERELPAADVPSAPAFDPASLPPIESIVADSDVRQFLQAQVPEELARAALRSAWTADPAIRDFVGIADNQWDFNDHAAMAGFGPLEATNYLVAQALGSLSTSSQETPENSAQAEQAALPGDNLPCIEPVEDPRRLPETTGVEASPSPGLPAPRSHGGALPR